MSRVLITPRAHDLVERIDAWAHRGRGRALVVKMGVSLVGPLLVLAGIAMTVLPGPGLVVVALGLALLALEYEWARTALALMGRALANARDAAYPRQGSRRRRVVGVVTAAGFVVGTGVLTAVVTTFVGAQTLL